MIDAPDIELVLQGGEPLDRQIRDQVRGLITAGVLRPGDELPTVRALAVGLAVNPSVVARAYTQLESEGFLTTAEGSGVFVAHPPPGVAAERREELVELCREFLARAAERGFGPADVLGAVQALLKPRYSP